jgi:hypothetical protein
LDYGNLSEEDRLLADLAGLQLAVEAQPFSWDNEPVA